MSCTNPKLAWLPIKPDKEGKRTLLFKTPTLSKLLLYKKVQTGCNKCIACESLRSVKQAVQLNCELKTTQGKSYFITLTYDDEHLPEDFSVHVEHIQGFIKKIRHHINRKTDITGKFRYSSRGEYGGLFQRPHYHLVAFDLNLPDLEIYSTQIIGTTKDLSGQQIDKKYDVYESEILNKIWANGTIKLINLEFENCLYVTQHHFAEKINDRIPDHEKYIIHPVTGKKIKRRNKAFSTRSSRPGIGKKYFEKYQSGIIVTDSIYILNKGEFSVPDYFIKLLKVVDQEQHDKLKEKRVQKIRPKSHKQNQYQAKYDEQLLGKKHLKNKTSLKAGKYYKDRNVK